MATPVIWTGPINFRTGPIAGARASTDVRDRSFMAEAGAGGGGGGGGGGGCRTGKTCSVGHAHCQVGGAGDVFVLRLLMGEGSGWGSCPI